MPESPLGPFYWTLITKVGLSEGIAPPAADAIARLLTGDVIDDACFYVEGADFPRALLRWVPGRGLALHCFEDASSWGYFLAGSSELSEPVVEIELGGQALERWSPELFVSEAVAKEALEFFLDRRLQKSGLYWVRTDQIPRVTIWEGLKGRLAWERSRARASDV